MIDVSRDDPCAGYDHDPRSPYYTAPASPRTGGRCLLCGRSLRENDDVVENDRVEMHRECFSEMPQEHTLACLGWKKYTPQNESCAICGYPIEPDDEGFSKDGKHIHSCCFHEQDTDDVLEAMGLTKQH